MNTSNTTCAIEPLTGNLPMQRQEYWFLLGLTIVSLIVHWFFLFDGLGEPDAARIATAVLRTYQNPESSRIGQITPLYQILLMAAMAAGIDKSHVPAMMNYGNFVLGSFCLIPLYLLWRRISSPQAAAIACVLYSFTPAFWFANLYGMPHLPAFFFLLWAAIVFLKAIQCDRPASLIGYSLLAAGLMLSSLLFKFDVLLYAGLFMGLVAVCQPASKRNYVIAVIVPLASILMSLAFTKIFHLVKPLTSGFAVRWHTDWPTDITAMKDTIPVWSVGAVFFVGILISGAYCLFQSSLRRYVFLAMAWAAPAMLFWCLRWGNSIRHMMIAFSVLIFLLSLTLVYACAGRRRLLPGIIAAGILLNYFLMPVQRYNVNRGGRLIETACSIQAYYNRIISNGVDLCNASFSEVVLFGGESIPYVEWEMLMRYDMAAEPQPVQVSYTVFDEPSKSWQARSSNAMLWVLKNPSGKQRRVQIVYVPFDTILLKEGSIPYWSCQESVIIVNRPEDGAGYDKKQ